MMAILRSSHGKVNFNLLISIITTWFAGVTRPCVGRSGCVPLSISGSRHLSLSISGDGCVSLSISGGRLSFLVHNSVHDTILHHMVVVRGNSSKDYNMGGKQMHMYAHVTRYVYCELQYICHSAAVVEEAVCTFVIGRG